MAATPCSVGSHLLCCKNAVGHICRHALAVIPPCLHLPLPPAVSLAGGQPLSSCRRLDPNRAPTAGHDRPSHQLRMSTTCLAPSSQLAICAAARALMMRQSFLIMVQSRKPLKMAMLLVELGLVKNQGFLNLVKLLKKAFGDENYEHYKNYYCTIEFVTCLQIQCCGFWLISLVLV